MVMKMSTEGGHKVSIIVPAYNEGEHIANNIREFIEAGENLDYDYELIIVDDGSTDHTYEEASKFNSGKVKVVTYPENQGKGYALQQGVKQVTGDMVTFIDADLELPPKQISTFLEHMKNGHDIVIGSKRHPRSKVDYPFKRRFLSTVYHMFVSVLFWMKVKDTQAGLKLFRRGILAEVLPRALVKRYAFDLEILAIAKHRGYEITEAPIVLNYGFNGSGVGWRSIWRIFIDTCAIFYRLRILKYYDKVK
jgi:glycosyltransferase involved in cell wall biosynthesis